MLDTIEQKQIADVLAGKPDKFILSNLADKTHLYKKTVIKKISLKGKEVYQIERFTERQAFHENVQPDVVADVIFEQFPSVYRQLNIFGTGGQWDYRVTKKGKLLSHVHRQAASAPAAEEQSLSRKQEGHAAIETETECADSKSEGGSLTGRGRESIVRQREGDGVSAKEVDRREGKSISERDAGQREKEGVHGKQEESASGKPERQTYGKKAEYSLTEKRIAVNGAAAASHNRKKNYVLEEGIVVPPLVDLGIFTKDGKVVRTMYDKYRQINRFLELVEDVVKEDTGKELHIIDFGCGKSYLTFILYYYLVELRRYQVQMTGLDLKEAVIWKCNETARKYHYDNLHFELGDINGYQAEGPVDMVVTLHACDTATDYAIYNAITWNARVILSVPCCQHEINAQIQSDELSLLTRYGIVKERVSALMTDAIRANVLEYCGYRTQLLEFVDLAHSPKNILIRAVRGNVSAAKREKARKEVEQLQEAFGLEQTLAKLCLEQRNPDAR